MSTTETTTTSGFKPKKSVALSGVAAGSTALCTVGRSGNDLHYRGYDIADLANGAAYEEIAHLLVHERLPNAAELSSYRAKLKKLRGLPSALRAVLEQIPATAHPMDVRGRNIQWCEQESISQGKVTIVMCRRNRAFVPEQEVHLVPVELCGEFFTRQDHIECLRRGTPG